MNIFEKTIERNIRKLSWKLFIKSNEKNKKQEEEEVEEEHFDSYVLERIEQLKQTFLEETGETFTDEEIIEILDRATHYGFFYLWTLEKMLNGNKLSFCKKIKYFLRETSDDDIVAYYLINLNHNAVTNSVLKKEEEKVRKK